MRVKTLISYRAGRAIAQLAGLLGPARAMPAGSAAFGGPATAPQPAAASPPVHRNGPTRAALRGQFGLLAPIQSVPIHLIGLLQS